MLFSHCEINTYRPISYVPKQITGKKKDDEQLKDILVFLSFNIYMFRNVCMCR